MAFSADLTLTPSSGVATTSGTSIVFSNVGSNSDGSKTLRRVAASGLALPHEMVISHQTTGKSDQKVDRHLVRIDKTFAAAGSIPEQTASVYLVLVAPRQTVTQAQIQDMVGTLLHHCNNVTNLAKILNGES